jgi:endonuclease YncB( thermonuclease family)
MIPIPAMMYPVLSLRVVDGDTLYVLASLWNMEAGFKLHMTGEGRLRLAGVDAPELSVLAQVDAANAVEQVVRLWVGKHPETRIRLDRADKYSARMVGDVIGEDGQSLGAYLLANKVVRPYNGEGPRASWSAAELQGVIEAANILLTATK